MTEHHITSEKLEELKKELENLKTVRRLDVAERLKRAKELGDLSENSEYFEAREEQQLVESKIFELEDIVKNATLITMSSGKSAVQVGSTIDVEKDGKTLRFSIVGPNEANPESGLISNESPLGKAFLGKKPGDMVKVKVPVGDVVYQVKSIE